MIQYIIINIVVVVVLTFVGIVQMLIFKLIQSAVISIYCWYCSVFKSSLIVLSSWITCMCLGKGIRLIELNETCESLAAKNDRWGHQPVSFRAPFNGSTGNGSKSVNRVVQFASPFGILDLIFSVLRFRKLFDACLASDEYSIDISLEKSNAYRISTTLDGQMDRWMDGWQIIFLFFFPPSVNDVVAAVVLSFSIATVMFCCRSLNRQNWFVVLSLFFDIYLIVVDVHSIIVHYMSYWRWFIGLIDRYNAHSTENGQWKSRRWEER